MARGGKRDETAIALRQSRVARLYLQGLSMAAIAQHEDVHRHTVESDLVVARQGWLESAAMAWGSRKEQEIAKIDHLEAVAWTEWERSLLPFMIKAKERRPLVEVVEGSPLVVTKRTTRTEERLGDPRYLTQVQWCITERCKILGVDAAKPPPLLTSPEDDAAIVAEASPEESAKIKEVREIMARLGKK